MGQRTVTLPFGGAGVARSAVSSLRMELSPRGEELMSVVVGNVIETAGWKLSFWSRARDSSGDGHRTDLWCNSEKEACQRFGEYKRILESHTLIITRVELVSPSRNEMRAV